MIMSKYPYTNTGEVLECKPYGTMSRLRVKFDVIDGDFTGSVIATVKAFREANNSFSKLKEGDKVTVAGHLRYDAPKDGYDGSYYIDGRAVRVEESAPELDLSEAESPF